MKKNIKIIVGCSCALLLTTISFVFATTSTKTNIEEQNALTAKAINKSTEILSTLNSDSKISSSYKTYNKLDNKEYFILENTDYTIQLQNDNSLKGIYSKDIETTQTTSNLSKESAKDYITNKYHELNLPSDYELNYLEKYDDIIWQANFEKNYNGIYNKYESVKVYFIPDSDEIIALTVFNESAKTTENNLTKEEAMQITSEKLNVNESEIVSATLEMEKANNYYDNSNTDTSIHSTWKVELQDKSIVYIDASTSNIIGGDKIHE